jgi:DNA replication protein DnaC
MAAALLAGRTVGRIWHGPPGRGKSARACAVALHVLHIGGSVRWVQWPAYLAALKDRLADGRGIGAEVARDLLCPVLVVDELGAGRQTDFAAEVAERLVGGRAEAGRPMLVTTNLEPDALRDMVGDRVWSRLAAYRVTPVGGDDLRVAQGDRAWGVMR